MKTSLASPLLSNAERAELSRIRPNSRAVIFRASPPPEDASELLSPDFVPSPVADFVPAIPPVWDAEISAEIAAHAEAIRAAEFDSLLENGPEDFSPDATEESEGETLPPDAEESEGETISPAAVPAAPRRAISAAPAAVATPPAAVSEFEALRLAILARRK